MERQETWLTVWVHEAKGLPRAAAPGVRAELWLDGALLARTAPRAGPGQLFWAERFHFEALPAARRLSLRLRGAGPAGVSVGRVVLELDEVSTPRAPAAGLERWFPVLGAPVGAALRARIRARRLRVLPSERYKELAEFLTFHYARLCGALEPALSAQAKEELAAAMVRVLRATGRAQVSSGDCADGAAWKLCSQGPGLNSNSESQTLDFLWDGFLLNFSGRGGAGGEVNLNAAGLLLCCEGRSLWPRLEAEGCA